MPDLSIARQALHDYKPRRALPGHAPRAAVAAIFHDVAGGAQLMFIERAHRDGDPWSGHLAFPGGHVEPGDTDIHHTAERETHEEIGWSLDSSHRVGQLDDMVGNVSAIAVAACVYATQQLQTPTFSCEVADLFWTPVADLLDPERRVKHTLSRQGEERHFPALDLLGQGRPLLWGVTYRFVTDLMRFFGHQLPT